MIVRIPKYRPNLMLIVTVSILLIGCSAAYYGTMEKLGYHKRDLMVNRVESVRDAQQEAKEQLKRPMRLSTQWPKNSEIIPNFENKLKF